MADMITQFWKWGMQNQASRDSEQHERVAVCSIYAQKVVDRFATSEISAFRSNDEPRVMDRPMYGAVHADLKHLDAGVGSTFMAAKHYGDESRQRRDELLARFAAEKLEESAEKVVE